MAGNTQRNQTNAHKCGASGKQEQRKNKKRKRKLAASKVSQNMGVVTSAICKGGNRQKGRKGATNTLAETVAVGTLKLQYGQVRGTRAPQC